ncbi:CU044_2847 family protein [Actinoallomurus sp. NPDC050550]|uniref:CU044_2847 family protein n=1 Tax=Actinoallomurus sp. NPDC050550 TaxID=3154937 RepID=UPI0033DB8BA7
MSQKYVEVRISDGITIPFAVNDSGDYDGPVPASRVREGISTRAEAALENGLHIVRAVANEIDKETAALANPPSKVSMEVGLTVTSGAAIVVATSSAQAHIKIGIEWENEKAKPGPNPGAA